LYLEGGTDVNRAEGIRVQLAEASKGSRVLGPPHHQTHHDALEAKSTSWVSYNYFPESSVKRQQDTEETAMVWRRRAGVESRWSMESFAGATRELHPAVFTVGRSGEPGRRGEWYSKYGGATVEAGLWGVWRWRRRVEAQGEMRRMELLGKSQSACAGRSGGVKNPVGGG